MRKKGFRYYCTAKDILAYSRLSAKDKLNWLEAANQFTYKALRGKTKKVWEMFRRGEI